MKRVIEIISKDKRYRKEPYPSRPALHSTWNVFLTGQHIEPGNPDRADFLTTEEMRDPGKMTAAKAKKFPHSAVINPDNVTLISHGRKLNLSLVKESSAGSIYPGDYEVPQDFALYQYLLEREFVARSEAEYVPGKHYFYILDKEAAAATKVSKRKLRFEAESYVRDKVPVSKYGDLALLLNYKIKNFNISVGTLSDTMIQAALLDACDNYPDVVLSCDFEKNSKVGKELFALKLTASEFVEKRSGAYYDGSKFLGATIEEVIATLDKEEELMAKFNRLMNK